MVNLFFGLFLILSSVPIYIYARKELKKIVYPEEPNGGIVSMKWAAIAGVVFGVFFLLAFFIQI